MKKGIFNLDQNYLMDLFFQIILNWKPGEQYVSNQMSNSAPLFVSGPANLRRLPLPAPTARGIMWQQQPLYQVERVIDGDTISVKTIGKVRYIGINTPETHHPTIGAEYFGREAFAANQRLTAGKPVRLEYDVLICSKKTTAGN
jgi:endonuclease YncB( thermonuclease family)